MKAALFKDEKEYIIYLKARDLGYWGS